MIPHCVELEKRTAARGELAKYDGLAIDGNCELENRIVTSASPDNVGGSFAFVNGKIAHATRFGRLPVSLHTKRMNL